MKLKRITWGALLILMILSLFSCSKKNTDSGEEGNPITFTLKIKLPDSSTRASVENPITSTGAVVTALDVYFYDKVSGVVHSKFTLSAADITAISSGPGLSFPNLHPAVDGVTIVANDNANKGLNIAQGTNMYNLFAIQLDVQYEQSFNDVTLYGNSEVFVELTPANPVAGVDYYTTQITIAPLVARIEVTGITCTQMNTVGFIQNLLLHAVFLDNTYQQTVLNTNLAVTNSLHSTTAAVVEGHPSEWWIYSYASGYPYIPNNDPSVTFSPDVADPTQSGTGAFAFQFIPSGSPWLRLLMRSTWSPKYYYLNIRSFQQFGNPITFQPGHIYRMQVPFIEPNATEFDDDAQDITVEVTVHEWSIVNGVVPG